MVTSRYPGYKLFRAGSMYSAKAVMKGLAMVKSHYHGYKWSQIRSVAGT